MSSLRRLGCLMLALALAIGVATHAAWAEGLDGTADVAASAMAACDDGDCGSTEPCEAADTCSLPCTGAGSGLLASAVMLDAPAAATAPCGTVQSAVGWSSPPDPHPPRLSILS